MGYTYTTKRKYLAYGDEGLQYEFSSDALTNREWTPLILELKQDVENATGYTYNHVLLNYYADGKSALGMHKGDEKNAGSGYTDCYLEFGCNEKN